MDKEMPSELVVHRIHRNEDIPTDLVVPRIHVEGALDHYPRALEATVKSQQTELDKCRQLYEEERRGRIDAERLEESIKTELINAQSTYALKLAEQRACHAEELEIKVEQRLSKAREESRHHMDLLSARCAQLEKDAALLRKLHADCRQEYEERSRADVQAKNAAIEESLRKTEDLHPRRVHFCTSLRASVACAGNARDAASLKKESALAGAREQHAEELRAVAKGRTSIDRRYGCLGNVFFLLIVAFAGVAHYAFVLHGQVQVASEAARASAADERVRQAEMVRLRDVESVATSCSPALEVVRRDVADVLETHYWSVQISHIARLHEKVVAAMVGCGVGVSPHVGDPPSSGGPPEK